MQNVLRGPDLKTSGFRKAAPIAGLAALLLAIAPFALRGPFVSASQDWGERPIAIALVNPHPHADPTQAQALADGVNAEREKRGLPPLVRDAELDKVAYAKAVDMAARGYFGHTDPNGVTFAQRMQAWHWPTQYVAENIAFDSSAQRAETAFVNSPEHYSNLVDPHEREIGVAVITVGNNQTFYVEDFSGNQ